MGEKLMVYIDGACKGNPGPGACAMVIKRNSGDSIKRNKFLGSNCTNNIAEWTGLISALKYVKQYMVIHPEISEIIIHSDSELVVKQFNRQYKIKQSHLIGLAMEAWEIAKGMPVSLKWIPRQRNSEADKLAGMVFTGR